MAKDADGATPHAGASARDRSATSTSASSSLAHVPRGANVVDLGWRASSAVLPRSAKPIENVGGASLVALQATVLSERERVRTAAASASGRSAVFTGDGAEIRAASRGKRKLTRDDVGVGGSNAGVRDRAARDVEEKIDKSSRGVHDALTRKAALYDRLSKGETALPNDDAYDVDFAAKSYEDGDSGADGAEFIRRGDMMSEDMHRELERRDWERTLDAEEREAELAAERRSMIFEIERGTERARDSIEEAKRAKAEAESKKRDAIKAAFLQKQLAKLKKRKAANT